MGLSTKQIAFVEHYLTHWNATKAATDAGYSERSARSIGSENLTKPDIQEAIAARLAELTMSADEVLTRLTEHARGSIAPFMRRTPEGDLRGFDLNDAQPLHLLHKVSLTTRTLNDAMIEEKITLELYDSQAALALLGKHHGLFVEKIDISTQEIGAFLDRLRDSLTPEEYARIVALAAGGRAAAE